MIKQSILKNIIFLIFTVIILNQKIHAENINFTKEQIETIKKIDSLYNNNKTLKSKFTQIDTNGEKLNGFMILSRPFNARVEYFNSDTIIISNKNTITIQDKLTHNKSYIPMNATPLNFIIGDQISLLDESKIKIVNYQEIDNNIIITIVSSKFYNLGTLTMIFDKSNNLLKEWIILNGKNTNRIIFNNPEISNKNLSSSFFNVHRIKNIDFNSI
jgi:hypothetical protein